MTTTARWFLVCALAMLAANRPAAAESFIPDFKLKPDDYTVLMAVDAQLSNGLRPFQAGAHAKFFIQGWHRSDQRAEWRVTAAESAEHDVQVLVNHVSQRELRLEVTAAGKTLATTLPAEARGWQRVLLPGTVLIPGGETTVKLRLQPTDGATNFDAQVHAVELVRPAIRAAMHQRALALRADAAWLQRARYGIMAHWTKESMPLHGDAKSYDQAVADFDVEAFADRAQQTGAGFVVFTTAHAFQYFPAPLASLEKILPGRASKRDLVAPLADALARRHMKLFLYYHLGAISDAAWLQASGFWETDATRFFANWQAIVSEAGERYGDKLAGWWFDDGAVTYYYRSAPWEKLDGAAKTGFPRRLVGFNPWVLNSPTEFQDFFCGEGFDDSRGYNRLLTPDGNGHYPSGTHAGLQGCATLTTERDWGHFRKNSPLDPPRRNAAQLTDLLQRFIACKSVPIFNLEITQDGQLSPQSIELFKEAAANLPPRRH